jgi:hypothetical protein
MKTLSSSMYSINLSSSHRRPTKVGHPWTRSTSQSKPLAPAKPLCPSCRREGQYGSRRGCRLRRRKFASNPELDLEVENSGTRAYWSSWRRISGVVVAKERRKKFNSDLKKVANNKELTVHVLGGDDYGEQEKFSEICYSFLCRSESQLSCKKRRGIR